ncbi:flavoprotein [Jiangella anatolica]|uniref:Flavoprotein n=1 Tax=Jiangella anatolica TaxID=2670374 RepID=A0A2W2BXN9_9ACTN|nr:flavoprotein [Jiangella anatolica]PZF80839.1 flavoprotein [Jiangella anatolica]
MIALVVTGAPLTRHVHRGVALARAGGRPVAVIATAAAGSWLDHDELARLDVPVLDTHRPPGTPKRLPPPDAVVLAPGTFNTINKLAAGIADTYALSVLCEALATRHPMAVVPFVSRSLAGHPAWPRSLATLAEAGARLVDPRTGGPWSGDPLEPGTGDTVAAAFDWRWVL